MSGPEAGQLPEGLSAYARSTSAETEVPVPPARAMAVLRDLRRLADWLTMHSGWRGTPPGGAAPGVEFDEQVLLMGIPADVSWVVGEVSDSRVALTGRGPMDLTLGLWLSVSEPGDGAAPSASTPGVAGDPVEGPLGATVRQERRGGADRLGGPSRRAARRRRRAGGAGRPAAGAAPAHRSACSTPARR